MSYGIYMVVHAGAVVQLDGGAAGDLLYVGRTQSRVAARIAGHVASKPDVVKRGFHSKHYDDEACFPKHRWHAKEAVPALLRRVIHEGDFYIVSLFGTSAVLPVETRTAIASDLEAYVLQRAVARGTLPPLNTRAEASRAVSPHVQWCSTPGAQGN